MKLRQLLPLIPAIALLAGCGNEIKINQQTASELANPNLTAQPNNLVIYPDDRPSIPDGKVTFQQNCASCHSGVGGGSAPVTGSNTTPDVMPAANAATTPSVTPPTGQQKSSFAFDQRWADSTKPIDIYRVVAFGEHNHKAFSSTLSTREIWNAVVYARSIGQPALTTKEIEAIDPVFGSNCAVCHGTKGDGDGPLMRNLEPVPANFQRFDRFFNRTDDVLFDHIANGIRWEGMPNFLGKKDSKKNVTFDEAYIKKLVQYIRKFQINQDPVMTAAAPGAATENPEAPGGADRTQPGGGAQPKPANK